MTKQLFAMLLCSAILFCAGSSLAADRYGGTGFTLVRQQQSQDLGGTLYEFRHDKTGAQVVYLDNGAQRKDFSIGFRTPPSDNKGANHVLEHSLLCGSEKYPLPNLMHYVRGNALAEALNASTSDDCTYYEIKTSNDTEYYQLMDIYLNGIFHPLLLTEENIFKQQGIRLEYVDGQVQYNGVVYNELRINSLESTENSVNFVAAQLYNELYGGTTPAYHSGGTLDALKSLTYEDVLRVYHTYYIPSNSMTYLAGEQDIRQTLQMLNQFFQPFQRQEVSLSFSDTKRRPEETITTYRVTADTKTVDIGFMFSGVPMWESAEELYARDIIYDQIAAKMQEWNANNYTSGGNTGGISNLALLVSEVPVEQTEEILQAYDSVLQQFSQNGFGDLAEAIDQTIMQKQNPYLYATELGIFNGILYHDDPFYYTDLSAAAQRLKENPKIFQEVLQTYFIDNPYRKTVISGNGAAQKEEPLILSEAQIEAIQQDTTAFQAWADTPDDPEVIASIPTLGTGAVQEPPEYSAPVHETASGMDFYYTPKGETASVELFFPAQITTEDLGYLQLLTSFVTRQLISAGLDSANLDLACMEQFRDTTVIHPQITLYLSSAGPDTAAAFQQVMDYLASGALWNGEAFSAYLDTAAADILANGYRDPYYLSYELKQSTQSQGSRFYAFTRGSTGQGSILYYHFLNDADPADYPSMLEKTRQLFDRLVLHSLPTVEYVGTEGYTAFRQAVCERFAEAEQKENANLSLPSGWDSAAIITPLQDANHFMLSGNLSDTSYAYSGKMNIIGGVLSAKYILPEMRGKYGAYGASVAIDQTGMTCAVAGLSDIDLALDIWQGMGDYLRNLAMTQKELDAIIVKTVTEFDNYYNDSDYGGILALSGKTAADIQRVRAEMLSTTVEDIRGYADLVDELAAQGHVFAVLGQAAADQAAFDFSYYANAGTLDITPRLTKHPSSYISGKNETQFCPDDMLTRAEAAVMLAGITADQRAAHGNAPYLDVHETDWFSAAVSALSEKGLLRGDGSGYFHPNSGITRAEFAAMLAPFIYGGETALPLDYGDIQPDDWFYSAMAKMVQNGYLSGYGDQTLRPENPITRAEAVTVLNRMLGQTAVADMPSPFSDIQGHWAMEEILAAVYGVPS